MDNFDNWFNLKKQVNCLRRRSFKVKEIWFVMLGQNIGCEQNGSGENFMRPVNVLKKFNRETFWGVPLTTRLKVGTKYFAIGDSRNSVALLSQLRLFDSKRLVRCKGVLSKQVFTRLV